MQMKYAQQDTSADWKKRGVLTGKLFGAAAEFSVPGENEGNDVNDKLRLWWPGMMAAGLPSALFAIAEFVARANIAVDGVVISSELKSVVPAHNRCVKTYTLKSIESGSVFTYAAGPNDESLPQSIPERRNRAQEERRAFLYD